MVDGQKGNAYAEILLTCIGYVRYMILDVFALGYACLQLDLTNAHKSWSCQTQLDDKNVTSPLLKWVQPAQPIHPIRYC